MQKIKKLPWIIFAAWLIAFCSYALLKKSEFIKRPKGPKNILLISLDDCRADHISCYGYDRLTSPFLDQLADQGIKFENAFVNTHGTIPSHTTMLSSLYAETHRVGLFNPGTTSFFWTIPENFPMLQEILQRNGYITLGVSEGKVLNKVGFKRGFTEFYSTEEVSVVDASSDALLRLITKYSNKNKPIFAFLHTLEIHSPYTPPKAYRQLFGNYSGNIQLCESSSLRNYRNDAPKLSAEDLDFLKVMYDRGIRFSDDILKNLFDALDELGFFNNCLVIITADHGEEFGDHGGLMHRSLLYEELIHVPLIITGTDVPPKKVVTQLVSCVDIMPTILGFAGIDAKIPMEGKNLLSQVQTSEDHEEAIFSQYGNCLYSIRTPRWKLMEKMGLPESKTEALLDQPQDNLEGKHVPPKRRANGFTYKKSHKADKALKVELYDLIIDPKEQRNLAAIRPEIVDSLSSKLVKWRKTRIRLGATKKRKIEYDEETLDKLRTLGYVE